MSISRQHLGLVVVNDSESSSCSVLRVDLLSRRQSELRPQPQCSPLPPPPVTLPSTDYRYLQGSRPNTNMTLQSVDIAVSTVTLTELLVRHILAKYYAALLMGCISVTLRPSVCPSRASDLLETGNRRNF